MKSLEELTNIIAKNIAYYRKLNHWTQADLAQKISYSDKAVSKWERGESLPDIYILALISELFGITVNDLITEKSVKELVSIKKKEKKNFIYNKSIIALLASGLVFFIAVVCFALLSMIFPKEKNFWIIFIDALPIVSIIFIVFSKLYWSPWARFLSITSLNWFLSLSLYVSINAFVEIEYLWMLFIISAAFQVLIIFWYLRKRKRA